MQLADDQLEAVEGILRCVDRFQHCCLTGGAGTGKTFTVQTLIEEIRMRGKHVSVCAPTHKACAVLREHLPESVKVMTIHSALGIVPKFNTQTGKTENKKVNEGALPIETSVLFVDEASMIDDQMFDDVMEEAQRMSFMIIWIGDYYQLAPVDNESRLSKVFSLVKNTFELTEIKRQAKGSEIIRLATALRMFMQGKGEIPKIISGGKVKDHSKKPDWFYKSVVPNIIKHPEDSRYIAYTNDTTITAANAARAKILQTLKKQPLVGEIAVMNKPVIRGDNIVLFNNQDVRFVSVNKDSLKFGEIIENGYECLVEPVNCSDGCSPASELVFLPENQNKLLKKVKAMKFKAAKLKDKERSIAFGRAYAFENLFADIRPGYAVTAHKSQGSTFHNAYLNLTDFDSMYKYDKPNYYRAIYTAVTRPSNKLHLKGTIR